MSEAEKQSIEAKDKEWVKPSDELIKEWDCKCKDYSYVHGRYNQSTGFFELNGLLDLTIDDVFAIMDYGYPNSAYSKTSNYVRIVRCRTTFPYLLDADQMNGVYGIFNNVEGAEILLVRDWYYYNPSNIIPIRKTRQFAYRSNNSLRIVKSKFQLFANDECNVHFYNAHFDVLEEIWLHSIQLPMDCFSKNTSLKLECWQYMIANAANTSAITIKVHADVMARMLDESNTEWHQLLVDATAKNIQFAV